MAVERIMMSRFQGNVHSRAFLNRLNALCLLFQALVVLVVLSCSTHDSIKTVEVPEINKNALNEIRQSTQASAGASREISPREEYEIGRSTAALIIENYKVSAKNEKITGYLNLICNALVINSPQPSLYNGYHVVLIGTRNDVNLFATPGGHLLLTEGFLDMARSEDEIAAMLAYGIAVIQLRQGIALIRNQRIVAGALIPPGSGKMLEDSLQDAASQMTAPSYIKNQVLEADLLALSLLSSAGYNVNAYAAVLNRVKKYHDDHKISIADFPSFESRIQNVEKNMAGYRTIDTSSFRITRYNRLFSR